MKQRGFTLIELLVVVAIIGILAAVGVNTFSGFQEKAKISATKANHKIIVKYILAETLKCDLGEIKVMSDELVCSGKTSSIVISAAVRALSKFKNPFAKGTSSYWNGVKIGATNTPDELVGFISLFATSDTEISVKSCNKTPCSNADNRQESFILIE